MFHRTITLERSGAIIAELDVARDRIDGQLYAIEGWHPDLGRVVLIEGDEGALLISEIPVPEEADDLRELASAPTSGEAGRRGPAAPMTGIFLPGWRCRDVWLESSPTA